jgi:flagellar biosynthesis protein FlhB
MNLVRESDAIIVDAKKCAVALLYDKETMEAPIVNVRGLSIIAQWIQFVAGLFNKPVFDNMKLSHDLFNSVNLFEYIDEDFYDEVARVYADIIYQDNEYMNNVLLEKFIDK